MRTTHIVKIHSLGAGGGHTRRHMGEHFLCHQFWLCKATGLGIYSIGVHSFEEEQNKTNK